jgi:hypothetical protein
MSTPFFATATATDTLNGAAGLADAWPAPVPVPTALLPVPPFEPAALLPDPMAAWVADVADRAQCPPDIVAVGAIVAVAAVVGRQVAIRPKVHDDWTVIANLWGLGVGPPGVMKTAGLHEGQRGLRRLIADARERHQAAIKTYEFDVMAAKARRAGVEERMKAAAKQGKPIDTFREEFESATVPDPPVERRYLVHDATVEKLGALLNQHPNGLLLFRDELGGFLRTMEREGHENDRAFYCEAWNGTTSYSYDRVARGTLHIDHACVSIVGGIQPVPLSAYLREAFGRGQDDGLIQRFQLMVYPDVPTTWHHVDRWPDTEARERVVELFQGLDRLDAEDLAAHPNGDDPPFLHFTPEAQARFDDWRGTLEHRLRSTEDHAVLVAHLAKYRSLMPSLALLLHLVDCATHGRGGHVSADATARAVAWCTYLEPHARRVYEGIVSPGRLAAAALARKLTAGALDNPFTTRDVRRKGWAGLTATAEEIAPALERLEDLHWVRREAVHNPEGGRPTVRFHINPGVRRES